MTLDRIGRSSTREGEVASTNAAGSFAKPTADVNVQAARSATIRLLRASMIAALLVPVALFLFASWVSYQDIHTLADERIERSLDVVQEQALRVFQSINLAQVAVANVLGDRTDAEISRDQSALHDQLKLIARELPEVQSIWVIDRTGHALVTGTLYPAPATVDYSGADFFRVHQDGDAGFYIGGHYDSQFGGRPFFPISRARRDSSGTFRGIIEISVLPGNFNRFYSRLVSTGGLQYAMIREDGLILTRYPQLPDHDARLDQNSGFGQTIAANPQGGYYTVASQIDQIERRFGVRRLVGYPVFMSTGIATSEMRREWLTGMGAHLIFGMPATLFLFGALADVLRRTKRLHAEQDRREAAEEAARQAQKMEAVGQLTGGVAHDFNNLLMIIIGNLEMIQRLFAKGLGTDWIKLHRCIANAMHGARRGATLTQQLLAFSRRQSLNPRPLDVNRLVKHLSEFLARTLGEIISLEVIGAAGLWKVEADHAQMEAAIVNLAVNARDAMPGGGKLTIETSNAYLDDVYCRRYADVRPGQYVLTAVSDTGAGMSQPVIDRAFEPFFTTKPPGRGTGLGLSQVYGFVKQSGGHLKIYSEPGQGTTVKVYLPRLLGNSDAEDQAEKPATGSGAGERILVVEDDAEVRAYVVETLSELNYQVSEAADAERAFEICQTQDFDLLLTDVVLPGMDGRRLADELKRQQSGLRVLFMTGYSRNAIVHQGRLDPGVDMVQKPVSANELAAKIREILSRSAAPAA
jgi:signal transduction histidine kinase/ActR/RegA family two-component response regulator